MNANFWAKVRKTKTCWFWTGSKTKAGYGNFGVGYSTELAHRIAFGDIPNERQIHHKCRNKLCVNPEHLEAITQTENLLKIDGAAGINKAKTHCPQGHLYGGNNLYVNENGRRCKRCHRERMRRVRSNSKIDTSRCKTSIT